MRKRLILSIEKIKKILKSLNQGLKHILQPIQNTLEKSRHAEAIMVIEVQEDQENNRRYNDKPLEHISQQYQRHGDSQQPAPANMEWHYFIAAFINVIQHGVRTTNIVMPQV